MTANVPQTNTSSSEKKGIFNKSLFKYDKDQDLYICPAGEELPYQRDVTERGLEQKIEFKLSLAWKKNHYLSKASKAFMAYLSSTLDSIN